MNDALSTQAYDELRTALRDALQRLISERSGDAADRASSLSPSRPCCRSPGWPSPPRAFVGSRAPASVQTDIAAVDAGMPDALRLNPDVHNARSVATTGASTLWLADLADGGRCMELTTTYLSERARPGLHDRLGARPHTHHGDAPERRSRRPGLARRHRGTRAAGERRIALAHAERWPSRPGALRRAALLRHRSHGRGRGRRSLARRHPGGRRRGRNRGGPGRPFRPTGMRAPPMSQGHCGGRHDPLGQQRLHECPRDRRRAPRPRTGLARVSSTTTATASRSNSRPTGCSTTTCRRIARGTS